MKRFLYHRRQWYDGQFNKAVPILPEDTVLLGELPKGLPLSFVFGDNGNRYSINRFYRSWKRAASRCGVEGVDLYGGTRHSSARALRKFGLTRIRRAEVIDQQVTIDDKLISRQVMYLRDSGVKEALIKLGWTPPQEARPTGRIFCGICSKEICKITIEDLLSNTTTVCCNTCRDKIIELEKQVETLDLPIGE